MSSDEKVRELFARYVERHVVDGERPDPERLCAATPELLEPLRAYIRQYEQVDAAFASPASDVDADPVERDLPAFEGFRTIERLGRGGGGEVFKLEDRELRRVVAAKVLGSGNRTGTGLGEFLREARALALFEDPRIVRIFEFRGQSDPPVLLMEYVDGFELNRVAGSLEYSQRARVMLEICEAVQHAHGLGIQHRDLKPANVLLDANLAPKILDFGLSQGDPERGHGVGTLEYMAPEQLDPSRPIDARTDIYALGVLLYEMLCGAVPYRQEAQAATIAAIERGRPRLPAEVEPDVPEPLQAIALKAMESNPVQRYESAREMALELRRFLDGSPVLARPTLYHSVLGRRLQPHLEQIREWLRIKLIYPHEAERLIGAYRNLELRDEDWIIRSRSLSISQISLYLGALLLLCGGLLYFVVYLHDAVEGLLMPALALGFPFVGLNVVAYRLHRRGKRAVAVAFFLAAVVLLPLFLLILLQEAGLWRLDTEDPFQLLGRFREGVPSNRQLQLAAAAAAAWAAWLGYRTRTLTLGAYFTALAIVTHLAVLTTFGLREWIDEARFDLLSVHLLPLLVLTLAGGMFAERRRWPWFGRPLYIAGAAVYVLALELLALEGKAFHYLGISAAPFAGEGDPQRLDTLAAMTINGLLIYGAAWLLDRRGTELMKTPAWLLYTVAPFAILEPVAYLNGVGDYSIRYAWFYLMLSLLITFLSHLRQRKSFYYAGLLNAGVALWQITNLSEWWDRPSWAITVLLLGLAVLVAGLSLHVTEGSRRRTWLARAPRKRAAVRLPCKPNGSY